MKMLEYIVSLIYPWTCVFCNSVLENGDICDECVSKLPYTKGDSIYQKFPFVDKCISPLYYKDNVRDSIHRYKFYGCSAYSRRYGEIMAECVENNLDCGGISMVSWIPLSKARLRKRGYDQAYLLAKEISERVGLPCVPTLRKVKNNAAQSTTRDAKQRRSNVAGAYVLYPDADVRDKYILLVDDVVTTGSTLGEAARVLKKSGAKCVYCVTLARHED